ncbi:mitochondrial carrier [Ceraceosorus guamensis]|uniref:Mitochondrial carrier n=1 Tax=Ceraceosorus guamensis TaxID=1522189 RepID=A0A316W0G2_9BASI|nr:mitochondrial carrier [Ceraceosorus guamensis]PWN43014.1 mitochondrial carrier [Ceraceosorus guamensis]
MAQEPLTPFGNALAGALGGVFSNAVIYPLDTVKTRIQAGTQEAEKGKKAVSKSSGDVTVRKGAGMLEGVVTIARSKEGVAGLYKGFGASMVNTFSTQFAYFYWYSVVRTLYINRLTKTGAAAAAAGAAVQLSTAIELLLGAVAGGLAQIFTIPVAVIATRQQLGGGTPKPSVSGRPAGAGPEPAQSGVAKAASKVVEDESFLGVAKDILREDGITGLWRGLKPSLVLTVNPAITYGVYERVKNVILAASADGKMTPGKSFLIGALSKTLATVVTFPYILSKIRLQARNTPYTGALDCLAKIAKEKGITGWYQGMQAQITKAVLAQALLFYFRDYFEVWARKLLQKQ